MYYSTEYVSPLGIITLAADESSLVGLWFKGQKYHGGTVPAAMIKRDDLPHFVVAKKWLDRYFNGEKPPVKELPLAPIGGVFRREVWRLLCEIPYGKVTTYGEIANKIAKNLNKIRMSGQAVGGAVGHNPISIIIPCHRVIGANGSLTGYAAGIETKIKLLEHEGINTDRFSVPKKGTAI